MGSLQTQQHQQQLSTQQQHYAAAASNWHTRNALGTTTITQTHAHFLLFFKVTVN